jgi:hypothetical protein
MAALPRREDGHFGLDWKNVFAFAGKLLGANLNGMGQTQSANARSDRVHEAVQVGRVVSGARTPESAIARV